MKNIFQEIKYLSNKMARELLFGILAKPLSDELPALEALLGQLKLKTRGIRRWEMIFFLYLTQNLTNHFADEEENICLFPTNRDQAGW